MLKGLTPKQQEMIRRLFEEGAVAPDDFRELNVLRRLKELDIAYQLVQSGAWCLSEYWIRIMSREDEDDPIATRPAPASQDRFERPDPVRTGKRPPAVYSNLQREELIDEILRKPL